MSLKAWIVASVGVFFLMLTYMLFIPIGNILRDTFIEIGAEYAPIMLIHQMVVWTFVLLGVGCIIYAIASSYMDTWDSGRV